MRFLDLLCLGIVAAQTATQPIKILLPAALMQSWTNATVSGQQVSNQACNSEIIAAMTYAEAIYTANGLSKDFLGAINTVLGVAGDIPQATDFRYKVGLLTNDYSKYLNVTLTQQANDLARSIAQASATAYSSSVTAALATSLAASRAYSTSTANTGPTATYVMPAHAYGIVNSATTTSSAFGILISALFLLV